MFTKAMVINVGQPDFDQKFSLFGNNVKNVHLYLLCIMFSMSGLDNCHNMNEIL